MSDIADTEEASRIREVLREQPLGMSIKEISAAVAMSRNSVAKYLEVMTAAGQLDLRHVGNAKLYTLSQRVPVSSLLQLAKEIIIVLDAQLQIVQTSDSMSQFFGLPREKIIRSRLSTLPIPLLTAAEENQLELLLNGGTSWKKEIRAVRQGSEIFLEGRFIPTVLNSGDAGITLILEDITARRLADRAMRDRDRLLYTIFQIPTIPRFFIDQNHKVVFWDRALEIMTGIKAEEVIGTNRHWKAFYKEEGKCLADLLVDGDMEGIARFAGGKCRRLPSFDLGFECTDFYPSLGQSGKWLHIAATLIRDSSGHVSGVMETVEDITEQKQREFVVVGESPQ